MIDFFFLKVAGNYHKANRNYDYISARPKMLNLGILSLHLINCLTFKV